MLIPIFDFANLCKNVIIELINREPIGWRSRLFPFLLSKQEGKGGDTMTVFESLVLMISFASLVVLLLDRDSNKKSRATLFSKEGGRNRLVTATQLAIYCVTV